MNLLVRTGGYFKTDIADVRRVAIDFLGRGALFFGGSGNLQVHVIDAINGLTYPFERVIGCIGVPGSLAGRQPRQP